MKNKDLSFEENLENLEKIVKELENGDTNLNDAISKFNEGMKIANACNETLEKATEIVKKVLTKDGTLENFDLEE